MAWSLSGFNPSGLFGSLMGSDSLSGASSLPVGVGMGGGLMGSMTAPLASGTAQGGVDAEASPFLQMALQQAMKGMSGQSGATMSPLPSAQDSGQAAVTLGAPSPVIPAVHPLMLANGLQRLNQF
ncbi:hypothetical protein PIN31115_02091 [Pandoraea iniqua]|uniref:Uncharacterized protein n=1 Tax=Pandoraea iniqua TaxID=2508288 RepID=A0A5E4ULH5_9BURK|nr:hypothetical protein PIN31115_02091 [Pandoraea iniqua]